MAVKSKINAENAELQRQISQLEALEKVNKLGFVPHEKVA